MGNVTISIEDGLHRKVRVDAAKAGLSMSRYMAEAAAEKLQRNEAKTSDERLKEHLEALERVFNGPKFPISENGRMPSAEERNARR